MCRTLTLLKSVRCCPKSAGRGVDSKLHAVAHGKYHNLNASITEIVLDPLTMSSKPLIFEGVDDLHTTSSRPLDGVNSDTLVDNT